MALTGKSKIKEVLANEKAAAILDEYLPGISTSPSTKQAMGMSLKALLAFPQTPIDKDKAAELIAKVEALEE